jgi:glycosyltransferase involved in cell wall biosynthesis
MKHTTNNQNPLVSVILPAYNAEGFLEAAVRSVMAQTVQNWELIILDDGSQDATCTIAQRLAEADERILFSPNGENMGVARTRNRGIALSREKLISDVWGYDFFGDDRTLDTHIKLLRKQLGPYADRITTLRGVGYRFET